MGQEDRQTVGLVKNSDCNYNELDWIIFYLENHSY